MQLRRGNLWSSKDPVVMVTGNSTLKLDGSVVMGRGAALQCKQRYSGIDHEFGALIKAAGQMYGVLFTSQYGRTIGLFQVKNAYRDDANLMLIRYSLAALTVHQEGGLIKGKQVSMNFPGIGAGRLAREKVLPILQNVGDWLTIWELE